MVEPKRTQNGTFCLYIAHNGQEFGIQNPELLICFFEQLCPFPPDRLEGSPQKNGRRFASVDQAFDYAPLSAPASILPQQVRFYIGWLRAWAPQMRMIRKNIFTVGRGRESDLLLPDRYISRRHLRLYYERGIWYACDLGTQTGTWLNQRRMRPFVKYALRRGDYLCLANRVGILFEPSTS